MKLKICNRKDFYAGLIFIFFGIVAMVEARNYVMGTAAHMGPGYIPISLGVILVLLGLIISGRSFSLSGEAFEPFALRPLLLVSVAVLAFTFLIKPLGLVLATLALVVINALGGGEFRLRELVALYLVLTVLAVGLFVYVLKVPFRVWP